MAKTLHSPRHQRLISRLAEARKNRGITQAEPAAVLGRPQSLVAKAERGERRLEVIEFADLARALAVDPGELLAAVVSH
ncbi:helix-turn-helix domain-containing protein [Phenylobacterium sp.]|jgi:transcriptional regulator with XRE-family HTH domain|uniref:helix-turn-helix domain-containing protein n=1 Tax=Phenylobacterium sp. TaxID=1871053 RepID=UPI0039C8FE5B